MKIARPAVLSRIFGATLFVAILVFGVLSLLGQKTVSSNPYINISELPESFMSEYLSDYAEVDGASSKQNMLIVTSLEPLEDDFGAKKIIAAANHQYFLEFASEAEKNTAYNRIGHRPNLSVTKNALYTFSEEEVESNYNSWGIEKMGLNHASSLLESYSSKNDVVVAIIDTGLDVDLFEQHYQDKLAGKYNVMSNDESVADSIGHGTHIAGTIAEGTPNNVKIYSIKMSNSRQFYSTDIITAVNYVTYYVKADVINMSFGGYTYAEPEYITIEAAREQNIVSIVAAGNESTNNPSYPASFDNTISVSAVDSDLHLATFSNFGSTIDFAAPGAGINSINGIKDGTSMAAPHVAAATAIAKSFKKDLTLEETIDFLKTQALDLGSKGKDQRFGWGFIDYSGARLCTDSSQSCDEFSFFETNIQTGIEISEPVLTKYNYGSLTNILGTKVKINNANGSYTEKALGDFGVDAEVTGYNPYAAGEQEITVKYANFTDTFIVTNPGSWESGWLYRVEGNDAILREYRDHNLDVKTLYLPETIDGHTVTSNDSGCLFSGPIEDQGINCTYPNSEDAKYYETIVFPASYKNASGYYGYTESGILQSVYRIVSLGDELEVGSNGFSNLKNLVSVDAKIKFTSDRYLEMDGSTVIKYDKYAFSGDEALTKIAIADGVEAIPEGTFSDCSSLTAINLPDSLEIIESLAFANSGIKSLHLGNRVQAIGNSAFDGDRYLEDVFISASVTEISDTAFRSAKSLKTIVVDQNNPVYDSRNSSNAIIRTSDNTLVAGSYNTTIPDSIETIGDNSFYGAELLREIEIPENVKNIGANAFSKTYYLQKVLLPHSITNIDETAFSDAGTGTPSGVVLWVWDNTYTKERAVGLDIPYVLRDNIGAEPAPIADITYEITPEGHTFHALEALSSDNIRIKVSYLDEETGKVMEEPEIITDFDAIYNDGVTDTLRGGNNKATLVFNTATGYHSIKIDLILFADYLTPEYAIPTGITAYAGQGLSEVKLPDGFSWMDGDEFVDESKTEYLAKFTPNDLVNYKPINNIPVAITIKVGTTFAEIFPDANLRTCIVENLNGQNSTNYIEETINLDAVFALTELNCIGSDDGMITNTRGLERLTDLKKLNLFNNSISKINLAKNQALESIDLRSNPISNLDIRNNSQLSEFLADEEKVWSGELIVQTSAYIEVRYADDGEERKVMDISGLNFLNGENFVIEGLDATYDRETKVITFDDRSNPSQFRIAVRLENGGAISYVLHGFPRRFYFDTYFDGKLLDKDFYYGYAYTGEKINLEELAMDVLDLYDMPGYELEDITILDVEDDFIVSTSDVRISFRFRKINSGNNEPDNPGDPDPNNPTPDNPTPENLNPSSNPNSNSGSDSNSSRNESNLYPSNNPVTSDDIMQVCVFFALLVAVGALTLVVPAKLERHARE